MSPRKRRKAVVRKVTRQPRRDAWYMEDIASYHKIIPKQDRDKALSLKRSGRDCVFYWDKVREEESKRHPAFISPRWELWCKKIKGIHKL